MAAQLARASHSMPAVSDGVLAAKRPYEGPMVTEFVRKVAPRLDVPDALQRLLDPLRPGAFLACRCPAARQQEFGSCFLRLHVLDPDWLAKTCRGAVRLAKAVKGKDTINLARGTSSFRSARRARVARKHEKLTGSSSTGGAASAGAGPANRFVCALHLCTAVASGVCGSVHVHAHVCEWVYWC